MSGKLDVYFSECSQRGYLIEFFFDLDNGLKDILKGALKRCNHLHEEHTKSVGAYLSREIQHQCMF